MTTIYDKKPSLFIRHFLLQFHHWISKNPFIVLFILQDIQHTPYFRRMQTHLSILTLSLNACLFFPYFPHAWKSSNTIFKGILEIKNYKSSTTSPCNFHSRYMNKTFRIKFVKLLIPKDHLIFMVLRKPLHSTSILFTEIKTKRDSSQLKTMFIIFYISNIVPNYLSRCLKKHSVEEEKVAFITLFFNINHPICTCHLQRIKIRLFQLINCLVGF